jgi:acyl-CoA synthetase (AMP-forming)/AMP-acid ligase II
VDGVPYSRAGLPERAVAIATGLLRTGCRPSDRVSLMTGNSLACGLAGVIVVPVNPDLTGPMLRRAVERIGPRGPTAA